MILKTLTHDRGSSDCWNFYDRIESASVFYDAASDMSCIAVKFEGSDSEVCIGLSDVAYLCNDSGGTIEKLYPAVQKRSCSVKTIKE